MYNIRSRGRGQVGVRVTFRISHVTSSFIRRRWKNIMLSASSTAELQYHHRTVITLFSIILSFTRMYRSFRSCSLPRRSRQQLASVSRQFTTGSENKARITLTLYRQLLEWTKSVEDDVPLSSFIPPIHMSPPQIDQTSLRLMATNDNNSRVDASIFPEGTIVKENQLTIPIRNASDVKNFFRGVFRLNSAPANPDKQKQRISLAFEGLKSLNELTQALEDFQRRRENHTDRENVAFRVGQGKNLHWNCDYLIQQL
jgi:hypothetical protein